MNKDLYKVLKQYPGLSVEVSFDSTMMCFIIRLTYKLHYKKYLLTFDVLNRYENTILILIQDFFRNINIEAKIEV